MDEAKSKQKFCDLLFICCRKRNNKTSSQEDYEVRTDSPYENSEENSNQKDDSVEGNNVKMHNDKSLIYDF